MVNAKSAFLDAYAELGDLENMMCIPAAGADTVLAYTADPETKRGAASCGLVPIVVIIPAGKYRGAVAR